MARRTCPGPPGPQPCPDRALTTAQRCPPCQAAAYKRQDQRRGTASRRGYTSSEYLHNRETLLALDDVCWLCGLPGATTADHVTPVSQGGTHALENLAPAHARCNSSRGAPGPQ